MAGIQRGWGSRDRGQPPGSLHLSSYFSLHLSVSFSNAARSALEQDLLSHSMCVWQREKMRQSEREVCSEDQRHHSLERLQENSVVWHGFFFLCTLPEKKNLISPEQHLLWCSQQIAHSLFEWAISIFHFCGYGKCLGWRSWPQNVIYGGEIMINSEEELSH